ncbi:MAG: hypothetical protein NTX03_11270 [Bacteroidetes bacterium]|nr:hypothetical protein [Bacteroidota bacterium]
MASEQEIKRSYTGQDSVLHTTAQTMVNSLRSELGVFTSRFSWMDASYADAFQAKLTACRNFPTDDGMATDLKVLSGDLKKGVVQSYKALQNLNGYAKIAFLADDVRRSVQGKEDWRKAQQDAVLMYRALQQAYEYANTDPIKTALIAKGYTQIEIDALETLSETINDLNNAQDAAKKNRQIATQQRIQLNNELYGIMQIVNTSAKVVWQGNAAQIGLFKLYTAPTKLPTIILATVTNAATGKPLKDATISIEELPKLAPKTTNKKGIGKVSSQKMGEVIHLKVVCVGFEVTIIEVKVKKGKVNGVGVLMNSE